MAGRLGFVALSLLFCLIPSASSYNVPKRKVWHQNIVTWTFRDPFHLLANQKSRRLVRSLIATAFALWEEALNGKLEFHEVTDLTNGDGLRKPSDVDIDILFARGDHGDNEAFDSIGGMVAHSEYPPKGILHLDADERWSFDGSDGVDLRYVIIHEVGHLLGLRHSRKQSSVMSKYYRNLSDGMRLPQVDVHSIRRLYGLKANHQNYS
ncbi:Matrixin [Teladorsagia circumcincta]|uniref:Matrixin n=1 Tax=Teladorsagia circumcincta TaxID=45464 RepID=A0A2G9V1C2_TELCI|nr:Matrixin [Teladorsagia circumcincta]